jgi:hypothetical protein
MRKNPDTRDEKAQQPGERQSTALPRRRRSELPVARAATGRTLPRLTNEEIDQLLEEKATGSKS